MQALDGSLRPGGAVEFEGIVRQLLQFLYLVPADYDEIILESRSSELLLRNLKSDISGGPWSPFALQ